MNFRFKFILGFVCLFTFNYAQDVKDLDEAEDTREKQEPVKVWDGTRDSTWYTKDKSASVFYISTAEELAGFATLVSTSKILFADKTIILTKDIMLNDTTNWKKWAEVATKPEGVNAWTPIGTSTSVIFNGIFDGNGHIISGVYINAVATKDINQGLFGFVGGTVKNLGITASYIRGNNYASGLIGYNKGTVINCFSIGTIVRLGITPVATSHVGGLVGQQIAAGKVNNCYSTSLVTDKDGDYFARAGGIVGNNAGTVTNSYYEKTSKGADKIYGNGAIDDTGKKTAEEMQSQDFAARLNNIAGLNDANKWVLIPEISAYPILTQDKAPNLDGKFENDDGGTQTNPFLITTVEHLKNLSELANKTDLKGYYFKLKNNIEFNDTWIPIGTTTQPFNGNFDGSSYVISGISTDQTSSYQGLFGYIGTDGVVKNVGVINSEIKGQNYVGGIAGYNAGTISSSYSTATVTGTTNAGGFVGKNEGSITVGYSVGELQFAGSNCETCRIIGGYSIDGMNIVEFVDELNKIAALFSMKEWIIGEANGGYPALSDGDSEYSGPASYLADGTGTEEDPYLISSPKQLEYVSLFVETGKETFRGKFIKLENDIKLNKAKEWMPIGTATFQSGTTSAVKAFEGTFDGDGKTISDIYINSPNIGYKGLFGYVSGGKLKNIKITDSNIKGSNYIGGLVGYSEVEIDNCSFSGTVAGVYAYKVVSIGGVRIGGLAGMSMNNIKNSYSTGTVTGNMFVGGLVGYISGVIEGSYSTSTVTGEGLGSTTSSNQNIGGLAGKINDNIGIISNSYSTGSVNGLGETICVGGLVGSGKEIRNNYSLGKVTGKECVGGLAGGITNAINNYYDNSINNTLADPRNEGKPTDELKKQQTYTEWDFDDIWKIDEDINKGYPYHIWNEENLKTEALSSSSTDNNSSSSTNIANGVQPPNNSIVSPPSTPVRPPQVIASCDGFVEGTKREHYGESKRQFCDKRDGKKYVYVTIGNQDWMAENLRYDYDQCGKPLGRCYGDDPANCEKYGMLYTIAEAEPDGWKLNDKRQTVVENLCPEGWHIPSHAELREMLTVADPAYEEGESSTGAGKNVSSELLKVRSSYNEWNKWGSKDGGGSDKYGFSALPGGYCGGGCPDNKPVWTGIGQISYWWTTDVGMPAALSITWNMSYTSITVADAMQSYPYSRFYARCMRNSNERNNTEVAVASSTKSGSECAVSKPDYSGFEEQVKEAYPDLGEIMEVPPSSSSNGNVTPPITTSILPQLALSNISAHLINKTIELQNVPPNAKIEVYNLQGKHIFTSGESLNRANRGSDNLRIQVHTGMYIIKVSLGSETKILRVPVM